MGVVLCKRAEGAPSTGAIASLGVRFDFRRCAVCDDAGQDLSSFDEVQQLRQRVVAQLPCRSSISILSRSMVFYCVEVRLRQRAH